MIATAKESKTIPALTNVFPYWEMVLRGILKIDGRGVKSRSWETKYRGPMLMYTSKCRYHSLPAEAYDLDPNEFPRGAIVGVANLVDVRPLTEAEKKTMFIQFNNVSRQKANGFGHLDRDWIHPYDIGFFFEDVTRFKEPVRFSRPGAVRTINVPLKVVAKAIEEVGFEL